MCDKSKAYQFSLIKQEKSTCLTKIYFFIFLRTQQVWIIVHPSATTSRHTKNMKATFDHNHKSKFTTSHRKEGKCWFQEYSIITTNNAYEVKGLKEANQVITLRIYGTGARNTACIWVNHTGFAHTSGSGSAGGYGYDRKSAAAQEAINNAGFSLSQDIGGVGESAIREALQAIAEEIGLKDYFLTTAHQ